MQGMIHGMGGTYWLSRILLVQRGHANFIYGCGEGLIFDWSLELCNFANLVHCGDKGGPATPPPVPPTPMPVARKTFPHKALESPSSVGDMAGSNNNGSPSSVGDGGVGSNNGLNG